MNTPDPPHSPIVNRTAEPPKIARWSAEECPFAIDYPVELLNRMRVRAIEGLHAVRGGLEVGGILFGRLYPNARTPLRLELVAERAIECAHANGPRFVLSPEDRARMEDVLAQARNDPETAGLSVAGLWMSHTRSGIQLTLDDAELWNGVFPQSWQIALVLKPLGGEPTRATFFCRKGGQIAPHRPENEFYADSHLSAATLTQSVPERPARYVAVSKEAPVPAPIAASPETITRAFPAAASIVLAAVLSAAVTAGAMFYYSSYHQPVVAAQDSGLQIEMFQTGTGILVHWNAKSPAIRDALSGSLTVRENGKSTSIPLDFTALQKGYRKIDSASGAPQTTLRTEQRDGSAAQATAVSPSSF